MIDITKKQYVISAIKRNLPQMKEILLPNDIYLYIGAQLSTQYIYNANGDQYILLGNAFHTKERNTSISEVTKLYSGNDINDLVNSWTGRWILITPKEIQIDACGLMSAFYVLGNEWCISSSLAIMSKITGVKSKRQVADQGITWQILPYTLVDGVMALLCTQKFTLQNKNLSVAFNQWIIDYRNLTTIEKSKRIGEILQNGICNIEYKSNRKIWIALTSGKDSRLVFASALKAGVKFKTFTLDYDYISNSDRKIPIVITKDYGIEHQYIKTKKLNKELEKKYKTFCAGNSLGTDMEFYAKGQFSKIPSDSIVIRGAIFEAGQKYGRSIACSDIDSFKKEIKIYYKNSFNNKMQSQAFENWMQYVENNPIEFIDIRDRMYIEQRVGGWASAIEQALDIIDWCSIHIANCRELVSLLLSATEEERNNLSLSFEPIKNMVPPLHSYPYNKSTIIDKVNLIIKTLKSPNKLREYMFHKVNKLFKQ